MGTGNPRRDASRRRLERQLNRRADEERDRARRRQRIVAGLAGVLVVVAVVVLAVVATSGGSKKKPHSSAAYIARKTSGPCAYATADRSTNPDLRDVGLPPDPTPTPKKTLTVAFATNRGPIVASLDGVDAPCNVQSLAYLIQKGFYNNTPCPRVVDTGIFVVQCGSGGSTTSGGPTYTVPDENLAKADYSAGAIAMANTGQPHTASSQFFFITKDSGSGLQKLYTVVGHVTKGLDILQQVASGGNDGSAGSAGGGAPKLSLVFKTVTITAVAPPGDVPGRGPAPTLVPASG
jgi:peptidyl-prolyl cis-trans isomerase B (cyclophilin B)